MSAAVSLQAQHDELAAAWFLPEPPDQGPHRAVIARLKRRWRQLEKLLPPLEAQALALAPALLACRLDARGLKSDAPGVDGVRASPRFGRLAAKLKVPVPTSQQQSRALVGALLVLHDEGFARVLVQPAEAISTHMVARVAERCAAATELYARLKLPVRFELLRPGSLDQATLARLLVLGGCLAGRPARWLTESMSAVPVTKKMRFDWVPHGPTASARVQLLLGWDPELDMVPENPFAAASEISRALLLALRKAPLFDRPVFRAHLRRELLPGRVPACLVSALRAALPDVTKKRAPQLEAVRTPGGVELRLRDGSRFASARTLYQARVRAMLLAQAVWGRVPEAWLTGPQWKKLAQKLGHERPRTTVLFALGHEGSALTLRLKAGHEPRMRELDAEGALKRIVACSARGHLVEVVPCSQAQQLEAMRLTQLSWRAAANRAEPMALTFGTRVLHFTGSRFKSYSAEVFHARPRRAVHLDAQSTPKSASALGPAVECDATLSGEHALLTYRSQGVTFREKVSLDALGPHLEASMRICATAAERAVFVLELDAPLQKRVESRRTHSLPVTALEVKGDLIDGLEVVIGDLWFGKRDLRAAAETILSTWPVGVRGLLDVRTVHVGTGGLHCDAMARLFARALIARRLTAHIDALNGTRRRAE